MTRRNACFDIDPQWGSHQPMLEAALAALPLGAQVIEHGAGMFSTPLIARYDVGVICIEETTGWRQWAQWFYRNAGRDAFMFDRVKTAFRYLEKASLVFIDGAARERSSLLRWAMDARVPAIIAHDTEDSQYGYRLRADGYEMTSDSNRPQTTTWRRL